MPKTKMKCCKQVILFEGVEKAESLLFNMEFCQISWVYSFKAVHVEYLPTGNPVLCG